MFKTNKNPFWWIPTLYFSQGLPFILINSVAIVIYKRLGIENDQIAFWTSWLYLPWVIKPLWSPLIEFLGTRRKWIVAMQLIFGVSLAGIAFLLPGPHFFQSTIALFWFMAFVSATQDIAIDGFYLHALEVREQAAFTGVRTAFYRLAMILGQGFLVMSAGFLAEQFSSNPSMVEFQKAWSFIFYCLSGVFLLIFIYHSRILPFPSTDLSISEGADQHKMKLSNALDVFKSFFMRKDIWIIIFVLLFFRFAEAQMNKMIAPFLMDSMVQGGMGLNEKEIGFAYGTLGVGAVMLGGILGGLAIAKKGLVFWIWPMVCVLHIPNLVFLYLSFHTDTAYWVVSPLLALEQFGYGFGSTAFMFYLMRVSEGQFKTSHYSIGTGIMALGMMFPGMWSGKLQMSLGGYIPFFIWVMVCTIPGFICGYWMKKHSRQLENRNNI